MGKAILFSILLATMYIPIRASRYPSRSVGLRRTIYEMSGFCFAYLILILYVYPYFRK
jgi:hypothetical protein